MKLYPFQGVGADWLASRRRAYLADSMGLGKSVQAARGARRAGVKSATLIAPPATLENWRREWKAWGPDGVELRCVSFGNLAQLERLASDPAELLVIDEAHYAKSHTAKRTLHALSAALACQRAWLLSGTPMPNHPGELWAPLRALWPEIPAQFGLRNHAQWVDFFCVTRKVKRPGSRQLVPVVVGAKAGPAAALREAIKPVFLRRTLDDVQLDLPPLRIDVQYLPLDKELRSVLGGPEFRDQTEPELGTSKLRRLLGEYKAPLIAQTIHDELDLDSYPKIVVLCHHTAVLNRMNEVLARFGVVRIDGSHTPAQRAEAIDRFNSDPGVRVFVGQQMAAGTGLNLQVAHEIVLAEPDWSPDANSQYIKRVHRIGSKLPVRARIFAVTGTLDEALMDILVRKVRMQTQLGLAARSVE